MFLNFKGIQISIIKQVIPDLVRLHLIPKVATSPTSQQAPKMPQTSWEVASTGACIRHLLLSSKLC